jgi:hypothetical protein
MTLEEELEPPEPQARSLLPSTDEYRKALSEAGSFNEKVAVVVTKSVSSMWAAYAFALLALLALPVIELGDGNLVSWLTGSFLQLVLLSVIIVGQNVLSRSADKRAQETYEMVRRAVEILERRINEAGNHDR